MRRLPSEEVTIRGGYHQRRLPSEEVTIRGGYHQRRLPSEEVTIRGGSNPRLCITQHSEPSTLLTELCRPNK